jgi:predicted esterase
MAIYKRDIVDINLESGNIHRTFLAHTIGYKDQKADHFGVRVFRDGEAVSLTGVSVQGVFMPPQGSPIAITSGNIVSGNTAEVVLPQACYDYNGQFCLAIKLVDSSNSVTGTVRIVDGVVDNTHASGTVAPTSAVPTYQEILSSYDAMVAATAAANGAIAATYSSSATYAVGDYCIHDGGLYRCTTAITTAEAWTSGHWTAAKLGTDLSAQKSALSQMADIPDAVRNLNVIDDAQYSTDQTNAGVTVHAVKYSGFRLTGELGSASATYLSRNILEFTYGKNYTLYIQSEKSDTNIKIGFRNSSGWVKDTNNVNIRTQKIGQPYVFSPKATAQGCYLAIVNTGNSAVTFSNDTYYVYVMEGSYTAEQITLINKLSSIANNYACDESDSVNAKYKAIRENGWQKLDYSDTRLYKDESLMNADGTISEVNEHGILVIPNAGGIYRIRFVLKEGTSAPLFVVKDSNETVKRVFYGNSESFDASLINTQYLYLVFPGGLAEGATIYINWLNKNVFGHSDDYVDSIGIQYERKLKEQPNGKDLFDPAEALATSAGYFAYDSGKQTKSTTYCGGEARFKAGDTLCVNKNCHIAYFDAYGAYISGEIGAGARTVPANTNGVMISCKVSEVGIFSANRDEIHFTVPINQNIEKQGENSSDYVDNESNMVNVNAVLKLPRTYSEEGQPVPIILITHGSTFCVTPSEWGSSADGAVVVSTPFDNMINLFTESGYAVCDINGYDNSIPNNTWGSQRAVMAYRKLVDYVLSKYNVQKMVNLYGFSMGGLVALNFLNMNLDIVKCAVLSAPVVDLYNQVFLGSANWNGQMKTSYGFTCDSWDDNKELTVGYDPTGKLIELDSKKYDFTCYPYMRIWHGTSDNNVSYTYSEALSEAIRNAGHDCTYRKVTNAGHEICYGDNTKCNNEYVYWFNRFNDTLLS